MSELLDLGEFSLRILTLDALIDSKKALDRPKDHHAVLELEIIRERLKKVGPHVPYAPRSTLDDIS